MNNKNYTNNLITTREAGWRYGIMSTVPYEQQKLYRQIILLLFGNINQPPVLLAEAPNPQVVLMFMLRIAIHDPQNVSGA